MDFTDFLPALSDRALFVGKTGSGKTFAAQHILPWYVDEETGVMRKRRHICIFDAKGLIRWPGYKRTTTIRDFARKANDPKQFPFIIYAPAWKEIRDPDCHEKFFRICYERGHTTVYVDEVYSICKLDYYPPSAHAILTRGRELRVSFIGATQRPARIPVQLMSECDIMYAFHLRMLDDRKKMAQMIPVEEQWLDPHALPEHKFYLYREGTVDATGPWQLDPP
jgi:hypothetical protein